MTQEGSTWTSSQKKAFSYIQSAVERGMTATKGLSEYRAGGGAIRDSSWYGLFKVTFGQVGVRENVLRIPETYTIPESMFQPTDFDFRSKYVAQMKVRGYCPELEQRITKWVTVESDELVTKREWRYGAQQAVDAGLGAPDFIIDTILEWQTYVRVR